ncbi:hypothetical protein C7974DRAFT_40227 [Boeremia exigua]|uniref:uncharacterized protein n=1 Tax=Boeremia exigua TaxID=749465 RepID=UPI001E8EBA1A|nr:uncharacterized protein C7974DRAFT_40227 [Boeremia exigua]KAH6618985.1 hypothetical protein C7974DRAFT_40227 [Boeremia exigua]
MVFLLGLARAAACWTSHSTAPARSRESTKTRETKTLRHAVQAESASETRMLIKTQDAVAIQDSSPRRHLPQHTYSKPYYIHTTHPFRIPSRSQTPLKRDSANPVLEAKHLCAEYLASSKAGSCVPEPAAAGSDCDWDGLGQWLGVGNGML